jgi:folate-binding protein YgfZ
VPATAAAVAALLDGSAISTTDRDVVTVDGPDAATFLQGQLSQDVAGMAPGAVALSFLLEPQGKVIAVLRVARDADDRFRLDGEAGTGPAVLARLQRYKLRIKAELTLVEGASHAAARSATLPKPEGALALPWPGLAGWDLPVDGGTRALPGGRVVPTSALDGVRVATLVPAAQDLDERSIPAETGLVDAAASFTKGCYTGQELVARMDSRGGAAPRSLRRIRGEGDPPAAGAALTATSTGKAAGSLTTVVPTEDGWAGLALVPRAVAVGDEVEVDGGAAGRVEQ